MKTMNAPNLTEFCVVDGAAIRRHIFPTSLLFVSTAGRGAAPSGAALAFFTGRVNQEVAA